ncbi:hypothetical protein VSU16_14615 (plasmid) [Cetobacterium somerae]|uniref:hypothetical protein n=1 Tax=Cetobacterium somerae TaxID=188913 RepID=UPI002E7B3284|nr:hypothetical protein [Cetobacterium somerae]WVJ03154.1 hypothetical protein VSU16_14615 [Cetobacterium somerae]
MENKFFYLSKKYAKNNGIWIYEESETRIDNYIEKYGKDVGEYEGTSIPNCPWYDEISDSIIEMPIYIQVQKGIKKLLPGEYINDDNELIYIPKPDFIINGYWDNKENKWNENYSKEELLEYYLNKKIVFFNSEVEAVQQIMFMKNNGLLSSEDNIDDLILYLNNINPHSIKTISKKVIRPIILEKYKL